MNLDITFCDKGCERGEDCVRYADKPNGEWVSISDFTATLEDGKPCEYFLDKEK